MPAKINMWLGKVTEHDMTLMGWLGRKISTQTNDGFIFISAGNTWIIDRKCEKQILGQKALVGLIFRICCKLTFPCLHKMQKCKRSFLYIYIYISF